MLPKQQCYSKNLTNLIKIRLLRQTNASLCMGLYDIGNTLDKIKTRTLYLKRVFMVQQKTAESAVSLLSLFTDRINFKMFFYQLKCQC